MRFVEKGNLFWLLVTDENGVEYYANFSQDLEFKNVVTPVMAGVQGILKEVVNEATRRIEQENGVILIENRPMYFIICLVKFETYSIHAQMSILCDYIDEHLIDDIKRFNGDVSVIEKKLSKFIDSQDLDWL